MTTVVSVGMRRLSGTVTSSIQAPAMWGANAHRCCMFVFFLQVIGLWGTAISIYNGSAVAVLKSIAAGATSAASSAGALAAKASAPKPTSKAASRAASRPAAQQPMAVAAAAVDPVPAPPAEVEEPTTAFAEQEEVVVAVPAVKEVKEAQQLSS